MRFLKPTTEEELAGQARRQQEGAFGEGKAEGQLEMAINIACKMIDNGLDDKAVSSMTGLSIEQIKELRDSTKL